jgi:hypothetical protein
MVGMKDRQRDSETGGDRQMEISRESGTEIHILTEMYKWT